MTGYFKNKIASNVEANPKLITMCMKEVQAFTHTAINSY